MQRLIAKFFVLAVVYLNFAFHSAAQISLLSWNLEKFGKSKSNETIEFIANTIKDYDIVTIQEVVAGDGGAQAVARLNDALNRKGFKWD